MKFHDETRDLGGSKTRGEISVHINKPEPYKGDQGPRGCKTKDEVPLGNEGSLMAIRPEGSLLCNGSVVPRVSSTRVSDSRFCFQGETGNVAAVAMDGAEMCHDIIIPCTG